MPGHEQAADEALKIQTSDAWPEIAQSPLLPSRGLTP
jgi:hypothetical protein